MAKNNKEQLPDIPETMEDYMLRQLKKTVILKDGSTLRDPHDGHERPHGHKDGQHLPEGKRQRE
jgi:hypothetical protein